MTVVTKWPDTRKQEVWGEGPKPLPEVRQVLVAGSLALLSRV